MEQVVVYIPKHYDSEEEPWKIYSRGVPCGAADDSLYRYFLTKKSSNLGNWKLQDEGKPVHRDSSSSIVVIGSKKKMRYMVNNNEEHREDDGHYWLMKEYKLSNVILHQFDDDCRDYVLYAIKKKFIETCSSEMDNVSEKFGAIQLIEKKHSGFRAWARDKMPRHFQTSTHVDKVYSPPYPINKSTFALLLDFPDHICGPRNHVVPQCLISCLPYVVCIAKFNVKPLQDPFQA
ncbi:hypothetical protein BC332_14679 [Capsicum chinense]|nr:hypothetical protein BC332_14679 [Capsicum chinense]